MLKICDKEGNIILTQDDEEMEPQLTEKGKELIDKRHQEEDEQDKESEG